MTLSNVSPVSASARCFTSRRNPAIISTKVTRLFSTWRFSCIRVVPSTRLSARMKRPSKPSSSAWFAGSPVSVLRLSKSKKKCGGHRGLIPCQFDQLGLAIHRVSRRRVRGAKINAQCVGVSGHDVVLEVIKRMGSLESPAGAVNREVPLSVTCNF